MARFPIDEGSERERCGACNYTGSDWIPLLPVQSSPYFTMACPHCGIVRIQEQPVELNSRELENLPSLETGS